MKILFVSSGNSKNGISSLIKEQADTISNNSIKIDFFPIIGKGLFGYLKNIRKLKRFLKSKKYDIIHAHYSFSGFIASLAGAKPLIVSLMGSDVYAKKVYLYIIRLFKRLFWDNIIVKSDIMRIKLNINDVHIIPNGVDFKKFKPLQRNEALSITKWNKDNKHVLFGANPNQKIKNYTLAKKAFELANIKNVKLHFIDNIPHEKVLYYINSSDVVLLTSIYEGSPNIVKEAMACNIPIISTDVGDVKKIIEGVKGCYITDHNPETISKCLIKALELGERTNGRKKIQNLKTEIIAKKILLLYYKMLNI